MRSTILLLLIVAVVLGITSALSASDGTNHVALDQTPTTVKNSVDNTLRSLRIGQSDDKTVEGRTLLSFSSLKKLIPGTSAYKAKKAAEKKELAKLFEIGHSFLDAGGKEAKFAKWREAGKSPREAYKGMRAVDTVTPEGAKKFSNEYKEYLKPAAYKAKKAAKEAEMVKLFTIDRSFLEAGKKKVKFAEWHEARKSPRDAYKGMIAVDTVTPDAAKTFSNEYKVYLKNLKKRAT